MLTIVSLWPNELTSFQLQMTCFKVVKCISYCSVLMAVKSNTATEHLWGRLNHVGYFLSTHPDNIATTLCCPILFSAFSCHFPYHKKSYGDGLQIIIEQPRFAGLWLNPIWKLCQCGSIQRCQNQSHLMARNTVALLMWNCFQLWQSLARLEMDSSPSSF